jgi:squalene-associated FAD-dependent desaturase
MSAQSTTTVSDVLVIGAGVAGLSAAVALSGAGAKVTVLERKPYVGGRAYSYPHPALDEVIDSQHVIVGCCVNLIDLFEHSGASQHMRWYDHIPFLEPATDERQTRCIEIGAGIMPAPGHAAGSFLRAGMLSAGDKLGISRALLEFLRGYPMSDEEPFSEWMKRAKQSERSVRHFWEPVIVSTLNDSFERCSTRYAGQVFHELFLKSSSGGRQGIPTQPLSEFYGHLVRLSEEQGARFHLRGSIEKIEQSQDSFWNATASDGTTYRGRNLVLALPFEQTARLLKSLPESSPQRSIILPKLDHFVYAPFTTIHIWFDRAVTELDQAALLDTRIQWMFNKSRIRRDESGTFQSGQYLELVIAASFAELQRTREDILTSALEELGRFFPKVREARVLKSGVLKEARATFSVLPGLDKFRPAADEAGGNLYLAGDWTRTGWPSTMEGAARSGRLAAEAIARASGSPAKFLSPELPPSGLMRLLDL